MAASVLGYPLCLLWQELYIYQQGTTASITGITFFHYPLFFLVCILLGNNRLRALVSASFAFSVVYLANLPLVYFMLIVVHPFLNSLSYVEFFQQNNQIYYGVIFLSNIVIAVCCLFAARWLRETKLKPPRKLLEVIEAVLAGNVRYKQLSIALNISVSTVKTHLRHIYQTTGVSNIAALSSLFHGYTPNHP
jgi:hypothetical protein